MVYIPRYIGMLQPYVAGKPIDELAREKGLTRIVKLASNENPLGPSPKAIAAVRDALAENHRYCDPGAFDLTQVLARKLGKSAGQIVCGAGTDSLLGYIVGAFSDFDDEVLTSHGTFIGIYVSTNKQGRRLRQVAMRDYRYDLPAIADAITERTRIVYIANPNNPTGTIVTRSEFETFMRRVPDSVLVILDEAYTSYAAACPEYPDGLKYDYENMIVTRTMSKDYGLAGLRVGYAIGPEPLIREVRKIKLPFEPSLPAQKAAIAALDDDEFLSKTVELNHRNLARLTDGFDRLGLSYVKSQANFVLLTFSSEVHAAEFSAECMDRGLILRHVKGFGVPEGVRINSGTDDETSFALEVIEQVWDRQRRTQGCEPDTNRAKG